MARIALGKQRRFSLGDLTPMRDWGYAGDYVEAMWLMLQQDVPDDYVIATGKAHSVYDFVTEAIRATGLLGNVDDYVDFDSQFVRPSEVDLLIGDASKAKTVLGWNPKVNFPELVAKMVEADLVLEADTN
jgi:GDPmannose 4,6-dehydratase